MNSNCPNQIMLSFLKLFLFGRIAVLLAFGFVIACNGVILSFEVGLLNSIIVIVKQIWSQYRINERTIHRMLSSICTRHFHLRIILFSLDFAWKDILIRGIKNLLIITSWIISNTFIFAFGLSLELVLSSLARYVNWSMQSLATVMWHIRRLVSDQVRHFNIVQVRRENPSMAILESSESSIWLLGQANLLDNHSSLGVWVNIIIGSVTSGGVISGAIWLNCWNAAISNLGMCRISGLWHEIRIEATIVLFGRPRD